MKSKIEKALLCLVMSLSVSTMAFAQDDGPPPGMYPPGFRPPPETPCGKLTPYGAEQIAAAAPATADAAPAPDSDGAPAARAGGRRGAAGLRGGRGGPPRPARTISIPDAPMLAYSPTPDLPAPPLGTQFGNIANVALLSNGNLIAYQRTQPNELLEYDSNNRLLRTFNENIAARPHGLRVDNKDNIWITDVSCNTVTKMSPTGDVVMVLGTNGKAGTWDEASGAHLFNQPTDLGFGPKGEIFVSTGHGGPDPRIVKFDKNGKFLTTWTLKHADGTAANIHTVVVDKKGNVYAGDREMEKIYVFDQNGKHLRDIQMHNLVCSLYIDKKGNLWMTAGQDGMIMRLDWNGKVLGWTGKEGKGPNEYGEAHYMVMTPDLKTIYIADTQNNHVMKLQANN
jgi:peptidylamidoglycolate lyase